MVLQATEPQLMAHYWDSWGKPSDGILTGHTTFLGYYDECINLKNTDLGDMKYCVYPILMLCKDQVSLKMVFITHQIHYCPICL